MAQENLAGNEAAALAQAIRKVVEKAITGEDLRIGVEETLAPVRQLTLRPLPTLASVGVVRGFALVGDILSPQVQHLGRTPPRERHGRDDRPVAQPCPGEMFALSKVAAGIQDSRKTIMWSRDPFAYALDQTGLATELRPSLQQQDPQSESQKIPRKLT